MCIRLTVSWIALHSSPPHSRLFLRVFVFDVSWDKVSRSQTCRVQAPSQQQLIWDDYFALGDQVSLVLGPTNGIAEG